MVNQFDDVQSIHSSRDNIQVKPSLKRWFKHAFYFGSSKRLLTAQQKQQLADIIAQAEDGHRGEIQVIIESYLPSRIAYQNNTRQRAEQLFAEHGIWDTEYNSGMLIYLNLCEHCVEIVADRGICSMVVTDEWEKICQDMLPYFKQKQFCEGLCRAIVELGNLLKQFYQDQTIVSDPKGNELSNEPRLL